MKTVTEMAKEAGFMVVHEGEPETGAWYECFTAEIERFAELVRADEREARSMRWDEYIAEAVKAEREACARVCELSDEDGEGPDSWDWHSKDYAAAIRARSNT